MKIFRYLYTGASLEEKRQEVFDLLKTYRLPKEIYVIVAPEKGPNPMEIIRGNFLKQDRYRNSDVLAVGVSGTEEEARELACGILLRVYRETGSFDVRAYLSVSREVTS